MKKTIIILIILLVILLGILLFIVFSRKLDIFNKLNEQEEAYLNGINNPGLMIDGVTPTKVTIDNIFFTTEGCIKEYIEYVTENNNEAIYSLIDYKYIDEKNITLENIGEYITKYTNSNISKTIEMYEVAGSKYYTYYAKHQLGTEIIYFIVNTDTSTNSFSIMPINSEEYEKKIVEPAKAFGNQEDSIKENEYNTISYKYYDEVDIVDKYFQDYLENALFNPEIAYNSLNEEYRKEKFGGLNEYKQYVEKNKEVLSGMCKEARRDYDEFDNYEEYEKYYAQVSKNGLDKYKIEEYEGYKKIICIDTYGNYYIFNVNSIMEYTLILDTYTIDLPEFLEKYNNSTDQQKVALNIDKFIQAINAKDYKYAYNCLADSFKNNYFKTQEEFENYAKENFYSSNNVEYNEFDTQGDVYTYSVILTDKETSEQKNKTFIVKLEEGTEFVLSFNR